MDRILYFGYVILTSIKHRFKLMQYSQLFSKKYSRTALFFLKEAYVYFLKYDMHPLDYFYFNAYYNKIFNPNEYANTLFMYRFHRILNDRCYIEFFYNKKLFHEKFKDLMGHEYIDLNRVGIDELKEWILTRNPEYLIVKEMKSVGGFGVKKVCVHIDNKSVLIDNLSIEKRFAYLQKFDLIEEYVVQHKLVNRLNPSCLNTVRVVSILDKSNKVHIVGTVIRLGVNSDVDNFHSGGIAVNVNTDTGCLEGVGFRLAPSEQEEFPYHPVTKICFNGYQLPNWGPLIETVKKACVIIPKVRTVGWDVAITPKGVSLIEGNHDWDKIIIEKALRSGIKKELLNYL